MTQYNFSFDGYADGTDLSAVPGWVRLSGSTGNIVVNSNGKLTFVSSNSQYRAALNSPNFKVVIQFAANWSVANSQILFRHVDSFNYLAIRNQSGGITVHKTVANVSTQLGGAFPYSPSPTDYLTIECQDDITKIWLGTTLIFTINESANKTGAAIGLRTTTTVPSANFIDSIVVTTSSVDSINGVTSSPTITVGQSNTVTTTDVGTTTSMSVSDGTRSISGMTSMPSGNGSFTIPFPYIDGAVVPIFGPVTAFFPGAIGTGIKPSILAIEPSWKQVIFSGATNISSRHLGSVVSLPDGQRFYYPATNEALIDADGAMEFKSLPYSFTGLLHRTHPGGNYSIEWLTINLAKDGVVEPGLTNGFAGKFLKGSLLKGKLL